MLIGEGKASDKHTLKKKNTHKKLSASLGGNFLNLMQGIYEKPATDVIFNGKKPALPLRSGATAESPHQYKRNEKNTLLERKK